MLLENVRESEENTTPVCQDTGALLFFVKHPPGVRPREIEKAVEDAVAEATSRTYLRPNAVDPITGKNSGNNLGHGSPVIHFEEWDEPALVIQLLQKGGGSENVGAQYSLPDSSLGAGRDMEGVRRCVLHAVYSAQGKGCAPGVITVGIGGDRASSFLEAKEQLLRPLDDNNSDPKLDALEKQLVEEANSLGIGPMGFGGKTTVLGVKIGWRHRLPACYFVSVSYMCWAARRARMTLREGQEVVYD
jgi:fumarate hydratase class I